MFKSKPKTTKTTAFSEFFRNAKSAEKKRTYAIVLEKSTAMQNDLMHAKPEPATGQS